MKMLILTAAALGLATPALAQDQPATPPAGEAHPTENVAATDLPVCSRTVTDRCIQRGAKMAYKAQKASKAHARKKS